MHLGHLRRSTVTVGAALPLAVAAFAVAAPTAAVAKTPHSRTSVPGSHPNWATTNNRTATVTSSKQVTGRMYLAPRSQSALDAAVQAVSTPGSASYHQFITPDAFRSTYGPTAAQINTVTSWAKSAGLATSVSSDNRYVSVTGTVKQIDAAFGTTLALFKYKGADRQAPSTALTVPDDVESAILGVTGLTEEPPLTTPQASPSYPQPPVYFNARPCSQYYGQVAAKYQADGTTPLPTFNGKTLDYAVCGYQPAQLRAAYGVAASGLTGAGVTMAIIDAYASPTLEQDANTYATNHGDPAFGPNQFTQTILGGFTHTGYGPKGCGAPGWNGEQTLDVEAEHAMAPSANIMYYGAVSCYDNDLNDALARVLNDNKASIVSNSYGEPEEAVSAANLHEETLLFEQAAMQGVTVNFSSGDNGDEVANTGIKQADAEGSNPYVTAVGGTALGVGADGSHLFEAGWGTDKYTLSSDGSSWTPVGYLYGAGGGYSTLFNRPSYQNGVVPANAPAGRAVPDVAMDADPTTGMLIGETQKFPNGKNGYGEFRIGGTSLASPLFTGMEADAIQHAGGGRIGFANPQIYSLSQSQPAAFYDIAKQHSNDGNVRVDYANGVDASGGLLYSIRTFDDDASLTTTKGWDDVTGVGSPTQAFLTSVTTQTGSSG